MDILEPDISWTFNLKMLPFKQALIVAKMSTCLQKLLPELIKKNYRHVYITSKHLREKIAFNGTNKNKFNNNSHMSQAAC